MKRSYRISVACLVFLAFSALNYGLFAEETPAEEIWILYEKAKTLMENREKPEMGEALRILRQAIEKAGIFPEAEIAIGDIYFSEGALELAENQYKKALDSQSLLRVPDEKFGVLYKVAEIYEIQGRYADMEKGLQEILADQPYYAKADRQKLRTAFLNSFIEKGVDNVLRLYRVENASFAVQAHAKLGWFYYRTGRFNPSSILNSLFALDIIITEAVKELRRTVPTYEFRTTEDFLDLAVRRDNLKQYLADTAFFSILYYLAAACYPSQHISRAKEIWRLLASFKTLPELVGPYGELSRRQLQSPWVESYINPSARKIEYPDS